MMYNNNGMCGNNSCLWIIILLILFCGCGNNFCGNYGGNSGGGCGCGCERHECC